MIDGGSDDKCFFHYNKHRGGCPVLGFLRQSAYKFFSILIFRNRSLLHSTNFHASAYKQTPIASPMTGQHPVQTPHKMHPPYPWFKTVWSLTDSFFTFDVVVPSSEKKD